MRNDKGNESHRKVYTLPLLFLRPSLLKIIWFLYCFVNLIEKLKYSNVIFSRWWQEGWLAGLGKQMQYFTIHSFLQQIYVKYACQLLVSSQSSGESGLAEARTELSFSCFKLWATGKQGPDLCNTHPLYVPLQGRCSIDIPSTELTKFKYNGNVFKILIYSQRNMGDVIKEN